MTNVRKVNSSDYDLVLPLFKGFATHTQVNPQDWKKIFHPIWENQRQDYGYLLEDQGEAVGFLGTLYSNRSISGKQQEFCNLTSWIVKPEYRAESLSLLFPLISHQDLTLTNFTASNRVIEVLLKLGFRSLEDHYRMILPLPYPSGAFEIITDPEKIEERLIGTDSAIFHDHKTLHCRHVLISSPTENCYLVLNPAIKRNRPVMFINYIGNKDFFVRAIQRCARALCRQLGVQGLMIGDHSLAGKHLPLALRIKRRHALLFRSKNVSPLQIDTLYSEIQVLGLKPV
jgi:hypothetical protein